MLLQPPSSTGLTVTATSSPSYTPRADPNFWYTMVLCGVTVFTGLLVVLCQFKLIIFMVPGRKVGVQYQSAGSEVNLNPIVPGRFLFPFPVYHIWTIMELERQAGLEAPTYELDVTAFYRSANRPALPTPALPTPALPTPALPPLLPHACVTRAPRSAQLPARSIPTFFHCFQPQNIQTQRATDMEGLDYNPDEGKSGSEQALEHSEEAGEKHKAIEASTDTPLNYKELAELASSHRREFQRYGKLDNIEKAIEYDDQALSLIPYDDSAIAGQLAKLGVDYSERFKRTGDMNDLAKSMEYKSRAVELTPNNHPHLPQQLANLGVDYNDRFQRTGDMNDLAKSMEYFSCAVELTPDNHPHLPQRLAILGVGYSDRFKRTGDMNDLAKSIEYFSCAVELTPDSHPHLPQQLANLGVDYNDRFQRTGDMNDLAKSMEYSSRAVELTPDNHPHLPQRLAILGVGYSDRFKRTGDMNDLAKSIEYFSCAVELTPDSHPHLPQQLANLGVDYNDRFKRTGDMNNLAKSMEYKSRAVELTPDNHPHLPQRFASLGSIEYFSRAVELTPNNHPHLPQRLASLGVDYSDRFKHTGDMNDLAKSMEYSSRAVKLTPDDHPHLPQRLAILGVDYSDRFKRTGDMSDLAKSMEYKSRAVELTPDNHPHLPQRLASLGVGYSDRFQRTGDMNDLAKSMEYKSRAVALTSDDHPDLSRHHFSLSLSYFTHYDHTSYKPSLSSAMLSLRTAAQLLAGPPQNRFMYALEWAQRAAKHNPDDCMEAYRTAVNLLPQFIWLGAPTDQQYQDLLMAEDLAVNAASTAILSSAFDVALEWLEHARCVVWSQSLALRSPLDRLHKSHPDIATQLHTISNALHQTDTESSASRKLTPELKTSIDRHDLAISYNRLLTQIRTLDGFEDFLLPMRSVRLIDAARSGPVIVINCSERCCDALVIIPGQVTISHVHLPNFTKKKAQEARDKMEASLWNKNLRERGVRLIPVPGYKDGFASVLLDLWTDIVKPVLDFLGYMESVPESGSDLPHVTWCPTGVLSFLPLHAAGDYGQPGCRQRPRVLAIGQANTPKHTLPGTTTELELIKAHTQSKGEYSQLIDSQATTAAVLDAMDEHDWVHLACHAHQNVINATKSGFFLHDGTLDLLRSTDGDHKLPDEAIHLASGMLMAGYPSQTEYMGADEGRKGGEWRGGSALHSAVAALREKVGEEEFGDGHAISYWIVG
ncbi:aromatic di-alanine and TPR containing protein [Rhizoctonia solani]|uniref:Aromatic di-alanine and TPR containing protein n=1 Tax=Rhizoctonia solani TaxID=456999 RepID=A0A8H8P5B7_9AGAM|nr:aromatic di-alanine and TPR containing protein [Rhizoctonia solani]QRW25921.1 aromatic di-alanine and TPR containing protein [Rhizoctonia solani]